MNKVDLILLFGATGKSGFHIANALIGHGFAVRIVARSKSKVTQMFQQKQISFQKIIEGELNDDQILTEAFKPSQAYGQVKYVISALGKSTKGKETVEEVEYLAQVKIIEKCKQAKVEKYIFITAILMERPWHVIAVLLNTLVPDVYHWKAKAQNYLRKSGLNYAIVRPPGLVGDDTDLTVTEYELDQGDKISGRITRCTLGLVIRDLIESKEVADKITFECAGTQRKKVKGNSLSFASLKPDTESNMVKSNHRAPKYVYGLTLLAFLALSAYLVVSKLSGAEK